MVDPWYCLDRVVPEGTSQVSRRSMVANHKQRTLNTRLSSGTSAGTFAASTGPYINHRAEAGTKNEPDTFFCTRSKKGLENRSSRSKPRSRWFLFSKGSGPPWRVPLRVDLNPLKKGIHEILGSKREGRFSDPFLRWYKKTCQVRFSYLLRHGNLCKGPRTLQKFPQKCQKIAGCWGRAVYVRNLWSPRNLAHPLRNDPV